MSMDGGSSGHDASEARDAGGGGSLDAGGNLDLYRSGTRIKMKVLTSPDGAKVFQGNYDSQRGEDCSFQVAADGVTRCLPTAIAGIASPASFFDDASCTVPVALSFGCSSVPSYVAVPISPPTCPPVPGVRVYAAAVRSGAVFFKASASAQCTQTTLSPDITTYRTSGAEIAPSEFQSATLDIE
jgi:hypothetical protein